ncbi:MAG: hypothetical protein PHN91_03360 [Patescibacteria group bacterium]|jgi:hypothetical protein|nr:hypothetical protein [Patescibacteria group bacterium]MDD4466809.1 hypothetical protein [Patescibacteria group bacterium]
MIATTIFIALLLLDAALILVALFGGESRLYADILAAVGAAFLSWYLALATLAGNIGDQIPVPATTVANITVLTANITETITTAEYTLRTVPTVDPAFGLLLSGVAAVATVLALALAITLGLDHLQET